jgi:hypothetical protein
VVPIRGGPVGVLVVLLHGGPSEASLLAHLAGLTRLNPGVCARPQAPGDSRLEGGVNRAKLKFTNINTTTSRVSVRNVNESAREGAKQIASK